MVESLETAAGVPTGGWTFGGLEGSGSIVEDRLSRRDLCAVHNVHTNTDTLWRS